MTDIHILPLPEPTFTGKQVSEALNRAADDIKDAADLPDSGVVDALNLLVNAAMTYLRTPQADLDAAIEENYEEERAEVLSWIGS